jgi:hypothetical protein
MIERIRRKPRLPDMPLLITESRNEFDEIRDALSREIKPSGIIEEMYTADVTYLVWEIRRLRRCKAAIINSEIGPTLASLLDRLLRKPGEPQEGSWLYSISAKAHNLAKEWFTEKAAKKEVSELLKRFQLDESAIESEAIRRAAADLEKIDRMIASAESRLNKALRCIAEYRGDFGRQLRESSHRIYSGKVLALEHSSDKIPSARA